MANRRDTRVDFISRVKKGKASSAEIQGLLKYKADEKFREYVYRKLSPRYQSIAYSNPFPKSYFDIGKDKAIPEIELNLFSELKWYFELILEFHNEVSTYLSAANDLEIAILHSDVELSWTSLEKLEESVSCSYYSLLTEFYLNEVFGDSDQNKEMLAEMLAHQSPNYKLIILAEFGRVRIENDYSAWQYDSIVEQHLKQYEKAASAFVDYAKFKLDPINYNTNFDYAFILLSDSDFALIDRYNTLKKLLPVILSKNKLTDDEKVQVFQYATKLSSIIDDSYWKNFDILGFDPLPLNIDEDNIYNVIQDCYFNGRYNEVISMCLNTFETTPNLSELYIFFLHSVIFEKENLSELLKPKSELFEILTLMMSLLEKSSTYNGDREKLLKKYQAISHFNFSNSILEFLYNEYQLNIPAHINSISHLHTVGLKYNFYRLLASPIKQKFTLRENESATFKFIRLMIANNSDLNPINYLPQKILVGYLISNKNYVVAQKTLHEIEKTCGKHEFVETWLLRNFLKCFINLGEYGKAADYLADYYFEKKYAYDHFIDSSLFEVLAENSDEFSGNISIPVLFQIYNQPQAAIYDTIANFLISNDVKKPSELLVNVSSWNNQKFQFFIEKCCIKENIEDSPYIYTIEELEKERITHLNFLKDFDPAGIEKYNLEILKITKEARIRKGLLQIHESRIYVDEKGILKVLDTDFQELFDRYLQLLDITHVDIYSLKFNNDNTSQEIQTAFYYKNPTSLADDVGQNVSNKIIVPLIRYVYFGNLFETINYHFVYNEDCGFKSFLSMRIRHGTFSNVLRSVYEKHFLISSKEVKTNLYQNIKFWDEKMPLQDEQKESLQRILKDFSRAIDEVIDKGLDWLSVNMENGLFNFQFTESELKNIYANRLGRIQDYDEFVKEVFKLLFERLEENLDLVREKLFQELSPKLVSLLESLQNDIKGSKLDFTNFNFIETYIVDCKTEVQVVSSQILNWFKISKNHYIEEFPLELILETSLDYVNSINRDAIAKGTVTTNNNCQVRFKGVHFETFGDIFINIFENIISKNKELEEDLKIEIFISCVDDRLEIVIKNNLSTDTNIKELKTKIDLTIKKIEDYRFNPLPTSFERGSGYLKLSKSIKGDLGRSDYVITPRVIENNYEVRIEFTTDNLINK